MKLCSVERPTPISADSSRCDVRAALSWAYARTASIGDTRGLHRPKFKRRCASLLVHRSIP